MNPAPLKMMARYGRSDNNCSSSSNYNYQKPKTFNIHPLSDHNNYVVKSSEQQQQQQQQQP